MSEVGGFRAYKILDESVSGAVFEEFELLNAQVGILRTANRALRSEIADHRKDIQYLADAALDCALAVDRGRELIKKYFPGGQS